MENEKDLSISLHPEQATGTYSNLAIITHSSSEFVLDFVTMLPGMPKPEVRSRIIMTPEHVKRLYYAMQENLEKFEQQFGKISLNQTQAPQGPTFPLGGFGNNGTQS